MSSYRPKPNIHAARDAKEAFEILLQMQSNYRIQYNSGWIPVLVSGEHAGPANYWLHELGLRFNPTPQPLDDTSPDGVWNFVCSVGKNHLYLFKHKRDALRFKALYG